jgi:hypothetical protein
MNKLILISLLGLFSCTQRAENEIKVSEYTLTPSEQQEPLEDVTVSIHFAVKSSHITSLEKGRIISNFKNIKEKQGSWRITGYTNIKNDSLALKRCRAIQYYLRKHFNAKNVEIVVVKLSPSIHTDQVEVVFHPYN